MALVCDIKSDVTNESSTAPIEATTQMTSEPQTEAEQQALDLEDGEIEDDEEEVTNTAEKEQQQQQQQQQQLPQQQQQQIQGQQQQPPPNDQKPGERRPEKRRHEKKHLTEAEKHVMHLHRLERLEREKREKYKREQGGDYLVIDDFASNIERALANAMKKDRGNSEEERDDEKRGRKRKKKEKDKKKNKFRKFDAQPMDVPDELEQTQRGVQGPTGVGVTAGFSPTNQTSKEASPIGDDYDSNDSEYSSDRSREDRRDRRKEQGATGGGFRRGSKAKKDGRGGARDREGGRKFRERSRERWNNEPQPKDASNLCLFYLQGKCSKADDCPYSHGTVSAMKLELCKFYLTDCCAKGDKCLYMHSDFPCKFYHTGLTCNAGESCKFAHGKPLNEGLRQILYKHIETAPREILGGFPRMSRDEALNMIAQTQKGLELKYGTVAVGGACDAAPDGTLRDDKPKDKPETKRNRPSRWQDPDPPVDAQPHQLGQFPFALKGFYSEQDQDLRVNSNGDIDMRTLTMPPPSMNQQTNAEQTKESERAEPDDVKDTRETEDGVGGGVEFLPKKQRELYLRIQAQQKDNVVEYQKEASDNEDRNIDWYSDDDDDDDNRLTIKDDVEDVKEKTDEGEETAAAAAAAVVASSPVVLPFSTPEIKPGEFIEKLGDLSKIDISAEVTRLLSSISAQTTPTQTQPATRDPRQAAQHPTTSKPLADPRRTRSSSTESRRDKISIYEQGSITTSTSDVDLRTQDQDTDLRDTDLRQQQQQQQQRPDIDLRNLGLQFKGIANYTPATEIDATIASHPPMPWRVHIVDIPRPDYTGLKLSAQDAQVTGDPRLRKIFRLSVDEKDSPASPKQSPRSSHHHVATTPLRVDPRRRKAEEKEGMTYTQQLAVLQSSAFYQSLTSNQKLLLNQELATRADQTGAHDPVLNGILTNLGLVGTPATANANVSALSILASVNNLSNPLGNVLGQNPNILTAAQNHLVNPNLMNQMAQSMVQPGLLGAAPGIPNLPPDFSMGFDPRNGGLLGSGPPPPYAGGGYQGGGGGGGDGYNNYGGDEYYDGGGPGGGYDGPPVGGGGGGGGGGPRGRGFGRDNRSRRGGRGFNRNNQRKFRTANRRRNMSP